MKLKNLRLYQFKNFQEKDFEFSDNINCFVGQNGKGKTNILDAIYYLSLTKSYLNYADAININFDADSFFIEGIWEIEQEEWIEKIIFHKENGKKISINGKNYDRISDHIGRFPAVIISPYDQDLISSGSELRRKFINTIISQTDINYLNQLMRYNKIIQQRNALLKYFYVNNTFDKLTLDIYDQELIPLGKNIFETRQKFISDFSKLFLDYYQKLSLTDEKVGLVYESQLENEDFGDLLMKNINKDKVLQYTSVGIHKDDIQFSLFDNPLKKIGSQGQRKTFLIALKLAQMSIIKNITGKTPLLLLDDIFDKLDENRVSNLIDLVNQSFFGQIFITDTHPERTEKLVKQIDENSLIIGL